MWIAIVSLSCSVWALSSRFKASIYGRVYDLGSRTFFLSLAARFRVLLATISSELIVNCTSFSIFYILYLNLKHIQRAVSPPSILNEILIFPLCSDPSSQLYRTNLRKFCSVWQFLRLRNWIRNALLITGRNRQIAMKEPEKTSIQMTEYPGILTYTPRDNERLALLRYRKYDMKVA